MPPPNEKRHANRRPFDGFSARELPSAPRAQPGAQSIDSRSSPSVIPAVRELSARRLTIRRTFPLLTQARAAMADAAPGPIALRIREKLQAAFSPDHLDVLNESYMHSVPKGSETHFKVPDLSGSSGLAVEIY